MVLEAGNERFDVPDVTEIAVETEHRVFDVAAMNPSPRHSGDHTFQIFIEVACTVLCTMVLLAKLKNHVKKKTDARDEEVRYKRFGLEEITEISKDEVGTGISAEEEMHEILNKLPPDNCTNEPTAVESCSRVTASMGVTLNKALEDGVMVANDKLARQKLDPSSEGGAEQLDELDSTKVKKKVPEEPEEPLVK